MVTGERLIIEEYPGNIVEEHLSRYRYSAGFANGKTILDVACGTGYGSSLLREAGAHKVYGVDISHEAAAYAKNRYQHPDIKFLQGDCARLPFENKRFDVVVSFETLEHIVNSDAFVVEVSRVIKDDGIFIVSTPNKAVCSPGREKPYNPYHVKEYYLKELIQLLEKSFDVVDARGQRIKEDKKGTLSTIADMIPLKIKYLIPLSMQNRLSGFIRRPIKAQDIDIGGNATERDTFFIALCRRPIAR